MSAEAIPLENEASANWVIELAEKKVAEWFEVLDRFRDWQRKELLEKEPTPELLRQHKVAVKLLLRVTRMMHAEAADPDFPDRRLAGEFAWRLRLLEEGWRMFHSGMTDAEADAILNQVFPE